MAAEGIQGYIAPNQVNVGAFSGAFATVSQMSGIPLVGNPDAMAQRLEELTGIVGTIAEALAHTAPVVNIHTVNTALLAARSINLEAQLNTVETRFDFSEHQRTNNPNAGAQSWSHKVASEHRAIQSIKNLRERQNWIQVVESKVCQLSDTNSPRGASFL